MASTDASVIVVVAEAGVPTPAAPLAVVTPRSSTLSVSSGSNTSSLRVSMVIAAVVLPAGIVTVPLGVV